jgi:hypothetical protein
MPTNAKSSSETAGIGSGEASAPAGRHRVRGWRPRTTRAKAGLAAVAAVNEQQDPVKYMTLFGQLAHANGLKVIQAPALDLATVTGSVLPRQTGESADQWFVRVNIAGKAAAAGDIFQLQDESNTTLGGQYSYMYNTTASQAQAANASVKVFSEVSTVNGTAAQMATAAQSISPDGYYVAAAGNIPQTDQFFALMKTAGY